MSTTAAVPLLGPPERRRKVIEQQNLEGAAFREVLQVPCRAHDAEPGQPCWKLSDSSRGVCGDRISRSIGEGHRERAKEREQRWIVEEGKRRRVRQRSDPEVVS